MKQSFIYVGLDGDDTQSHGSAFAKHTGVVVDFYCRPTLKGLLRQLEKLRQHFSGCAFRVCDEASYLGYTWQRDLAEQGYHCVMGSIHLFHNKQVKISYASIVMD